jgi:hypothetical protein
MDAQIAARGDRLVAVWTTESKEDRFGRGPMATACSSDGGRTWTAGPNPADDGSTGGHAFVDVAADDSGAFHVVWLDGRESDKGKGARYARSTDGGASWSVNATLDAQTCECCWNTITTAPRGRVLILYRDRDPRDMKLAASDDGGISWRQPVAVGDFGWNLNGCPHVGGGICVSAGAAGDEMSLHAVVWTAKDTQTRGAYVLSSTDAGKTWGQPVRLGTAESRDADLAGDEQKVVAVWDEPDTGAVFVSASVDGGKTWSGQQRLNVDESTADHPRVIHTASGFRAFWTEQTAGQGQPKRWVSRRLK